MSSEAHDEVSLLRAELAALLDSEKICTITNTLVDSAISKLQPSSISRLDNYISPRTIEAEPHDLKSIVIRLERIERELGLTADVIEPLNNDEIQRTQS